ncbi:uncharacterized protein PFL1_04399 [Pseudozyma flocculosa PF-1]|uniref:Uncharacterized protein n=1 Tax=Pseudozyma flocculosa PF-1 TaxID=1277687 RepID=A0A061H5A9_9BASI|nr:uncharacterized protein PFL1_04399 [Pseudozyma flocculosa PF-1]EPQ28072.1 hypothetical protein PFL1_04399 [Pseudozyma flocculosa PF-1]
MWHRGDARRPDYRDDRPPPRYPDGYPPPPFPASSSSRRSIDEERDRYGYPRPRADYGYPPDRERDRDREREREREYAYRRDREREREHPYARDRERDRDRRIDWERERAYGYARERELDRRGSRGARELERDARRRSTSPADLALAKDDAGGPPRAASPDHDRNRDAIRPIVDSSSRHPAGGYATGSSPPHGPRSHPSRQPATLRGTGGWPARGDGPSRWGGAARREDPSPRSLIRKRDSEGAPELPDLAPVPSSSAAAVQPQHPSLDAAHASWDDAAPAALPTGSRKATSQRPKDDSSQEIVNPYSGTVRTSSGTPRESGQSPSTPLRSQHAHVHAHAQHHQRPASTPTAATAATHHFSFAIKHTPDIDRELAALEAARRQFLVDFTCGPKRQAIRAAQWDQRDAQLELSNASHRVQLCTEALRSLKEEADKYTLAENQKELAGA